jgi:hypothetical protein
MDEQTLRAWIRGTLTPPRRREVTIWMLRCNDPHLPALMEALTREYEDEKADERLLNTVPGARILVDAWHWLVDAGRAAWTAGDASSALAVLSTAVPVEPDGLAVQESHGGVLQLTIRLSAASDVAVFVSDDSGTDPSTLLAEHLNAGTWANIAAWQPEPGDGRTTFWLAIGSSPPGPTLDQCLIAARSGAVKVWALRWEPNG